MNLIEQRSLIGRADLNMYIDHALPANKTKTNKMDRDLCVCLNGHSKLNTQYFYMGIVRFESQEYGFGNKMQVFAKLIKIRLF